MGIPNWNLIEVPETDNPYAPPRYEAEETVQYNMNSRVRVITNHMGRATYSERGFTNYTIQEIVDDGISQGHWEQEQIDNGNIPNYNDIVQYARELHYEHGEIDEYDDIEYDNHDQDDWEIQDIELID